MFHRFQRYRLPTHGRNALVRKHSKLFGANPVHAHDQESPGRNPGVEEDNLDVSRVMASPQSTSWPLFPWVGSETTLMEALSAKLYSAFPSLDGCSFFMGLSRIPKIPESNYILLPVTKRKRISMSSRVRRTTFLRLN